MIDKVSSEGARSLVDKVWAIFACSRDNDKVLVVKGLDCSGETFMRLHCAVQILNFYPNENNVMFLVEAVEK